MSATDQATQQRRFAKAAVLAVIYVVVPLLGLGFAAVLDAAGVDVLPRRVDTYASAQGVGYIALALLATVIFLVGPWIAAAWYLRRDRRTRSQSTSAG